MVYVVQNDETDVSLFDSKFTKQTPIDSPTDGSILSSSANQVFYVSVKVVSALLICLMATGAALADNYITSVQLTTKNGRH